MADKENKPSAKHRTAVSRENKVLKQRLNLTPVDKSLKKKDTVEPEITEIHSDSNYELATPLPEDKMVDTIINIVYNNNKVNPVLLEDTNYMNQTVRNTENKSKRKAPATATRATPAKKPLLESIIELKKFKNRAGSHL